MSAQLSRSALLIMDVQQGIIERVPDQEAFLARNKQAIAYAHQNNILVILVVVGFRSTTIEVSASNKMFTTIKQNANPGFIDPKPLIIPQNNDIVVTKRRVSAFSGSDLDVILRAQHIQHLILGGISTGGVVLSTVREAADKDYTITILSDLCFDADQEVQDILLNKVFLRQAEVMTTEEWKETMKT